jgi:hypothetical protein
MSFRDLYRTWRQQRERQISSNRYRPIQRIDPYGSQSENKVDCSNRADALVFFHLLIFIGWRCWHTAAAIRGITRTPFADEARNGVHQIEKSITRKNNTLIFVSVSSNARLSTQAMFAGEFY